MDRRTFLAAAAGAVGGTALSGCAELVEEPAPDGNAGDTASPDLDTLDGETGEIDDRLQLVEYDLYGAAESIVITGVLENTGDAAFAVIEVTVTLRDGESVVEEFTDASDDELEELLSGERWRFSVGLDNEALSSATEYTLSVAGETDETGGE